MVAEWYKWDSLDHNKKGRFPIWKEKNINYIEDITWPHGDTKFIFECLYYINTNEIPKNFTLIVFCCERRDLLCSHSNGDISRVKILFSRESSHKYFIGVHIIESFILSKLLDRGLLETRSSLDLLF